MEVNSSLRITAKTVDDPLWAELMGKLSPLYDGSLQLIFPDEWNEKYYSWFHEIEREDFRLELRYAYEEIARLLTHPNPLFFFVTRNGEPEILVLGYSLKKEQEKTFYLDTFAVRQKGRRIGQIILGFLIEWARNMEYHAFLLDTEEEDEKGIPLRRFYEKNGFRVVARTQTGNLTMRLSLQRS